MNARLNNARAAQIMRERDDAAEGKRGELCPHCRRAGGEVRKVRRDRVSLRCSICAHLWRTDGKAKKTGEQKTGGKENSGNRQTKTIREVAERLAAEIRQRRR